MRATDSSIIFPYSGVTDLSGFMASANGDVATPPVPSDNRSMAFSKVGIMPNTPMEPVMLIGSVTIVSAPSATQ
mgnify:CR=1 FL=1